jgi:hypothetical protein
MNARVSILVFSAALLCGVGANAACPPGQTKGCGTVDFNAVPEISQQIISREAASTAAKKSGPPDLAAKEPYTGPTVGVSDKARRAPMVGYRWSID